MPTHFDEAAGHELASAVRRVVDSEEFDYAALARGAHRRAQRQRRRRAIGVGAGVLVAVPAVVGAALGVPSLLPSGIPPASAPSVVAAQPLHEQESAETTSFETDTNSGAQQSDPGTTQGDQNETQVWAAPWQDGIPPAAEPDPSDEEDGTELRNTWTVPDARPTGIAGLDALGAPIATFNYPWTVPVDGLMSCDPARPEGLLPLSGQSHLYDAGGTLALSIEVTGWQDSVLARDALLADRDLLCSWDQPPGEPQRWPGHEGDPDYLLLSPPGADRSAAIVRQGDYLVAVTSPTNTAQDVALAAEVSAKMAANLEALDPAHGRD